MALLYIGDAIAKHIIHQRMLKFNIASVRDDGAANRVVMNGQPGYLGNSSVRLQYLKDGWINLTGDNVDESNGWKLLSIFTLEPGTYTFTGMKEQDENTIALQLYIEDDIGASRYIFQYDEDVNITIEKPVKATLHIRVYPKVEGIDVKVRPAVYKDE